MTPLMELSHINMVFTKRIGLAKHNIHVLKDLNLTINKGEILAIVGESGCGKTTIGKIITGIYKPNTGKILLEGKNVSHSLMGKNITSYRAVQFIQQDSYAALNPVKTIYQSLYAPIKSYNKKLTKVEIDQQINELMNQVGLNPPEQFLNKYPHQLSGGQRQRILMARALTSKPKLIVADEPVSMIDVSLRLSILGLMNELNETLDISFVYITHDLSTARYIAKNGSICVMYLGEIVEKGPIDEVILHPKHPYTKALIASVPSPNPLAEYKDIPLKTMELGDIENRQIGCPFAPRCLYVTPRCKENIPYYKVDNSQVKCILYGENNDK